MVLPMIARGAFGAGIGVLSGLGMGFGYGYGVRAGYHAYKPSSNKNITNMVMSPEPKTAGIGMGLHTAEQIHNKTPLPVTPQPSMEGDPSKGYFDQREYTNPITGMTQSRESIIRKGGMHGLSPKISLHRFQKGLHPFGKHRTQIHKYTTKR